jgi:hypothetical protein
MLYICRDCGAWQFLNHVSLTPVAAVNYVHVCPDCASDMDSYRADEKLKFITPKRARKSADDDKRQRSEQRDE